MENATIQRGVPTLKEVIGSFQAGSFKCDSLENLSVLVKAGTYMCRYTRSNRLSKLALANWLKANAGKTETDCPDSIKNYWTYELLNVPDKEGVRIHAFNFFFQSDACISLGQHVKDFNNDDEDDVQNSRDTIRAFEHFMKFQDFALTIID